MSSNYQMKWKMTLWEAPFLIVGLAAVSCWGTCKIFHRWMFYILATKGFQVKKRKKLHTQPRATSFDLVKILVCEKSLKEDGVFSAGLLRERRFTAQDLPIITLIYSALKNRVFELMYSRRRYSASLATKTVLRKCCCSQCPDDIYHW